MAGVHLVNLATGNQSDHSKRQKIFYYHADDFAALGLTRGPAISHILERSGRKRDHFFKDRWNHLAITVKEFRRDAETLEAVTFACESHSQVPAGRFYEGFHSITSNMQ